MTKFKLYSTVANLKKDSPWLFGFHGKRERERRGGWGIRGGKCEQMGDDR